jgi:hypothetical protein
VYLGHGGWLVDGEVPVVGRVELVVLVGCG